MDKEAPAPYQFVLLTHHPWSPWSPRKSTIMTIKGNLINIANLFDTIGENSLAGDTWVVIQNIIRMEDKI